MRLLNRDFTIAAAVAAALGHFRCQTYAFASGFRRRRRRRCHYHCEPLMEMRFFAPAKRYDSIYDLIFVIVA